LFVKAISTQSPWFARSTARWMGSSFAQADGHEVRLLLGAHGRDPIGRDVHLPRGSWSPKRLSGMSTSMACTA
jgi:hypothetical protein